METQDPRPLPDNVVAFKIPEERRAPQKWWERARAGHLYGFSDGKPVAGKSMDRFGGDAA